MLRRVWQWAAAFFDSIAQAHVELDQLKWRVRELEEAVDHLEQWKSSLAPPPKGKVPFIYEVSGRGSNGKPPG